MTLVLSACAALIGCVEDKTDSVPHRIVVIGDIHALDYSAAQPRHRTSMLSSLMKLLQDMEYDTTSLPDESWKEQTAQILEHTLVRESYHVRGRLSSDVESLSMAKGAQ